MNKSPLLMSATLCLVSFIHLATAQADSEPKHEFLILPETKKKIEFFWTQPPGSGPFPVLLLIHPHQEWTNKIGAEAFVSSGALKSWSQKGWLTIAFSQPGYGASDGPADFCGPATQLGARAIIEHFRKMTIVKENSFVIYGGSRGAAVAALTASQDTHLAGVVLRSGLYDFVDAYKNLPWYSPIKISMLWEIGWATDEKLQLRSPLFAADKIRAPILMLHGEADDRAPLKYAKLFAEKVRSNGEPVDLIIFDSEHIIPQKKLQEYMQDFLEKHRK